MNGLRALPAELSPAAALGMLTLGLLLIYVELNRPGRVVSGALGLLVLLLACARLGAAHPRPGAVVLVATAAVLLAVDLVRRTHMAVALAATLALVLGFRELMMPPVVWMVCILCGVAVGGTTAALTRVARRARANKAGPKGRKSGEAGEATKL